MRTNALRTHKIRLFLILLLSLTFSGCISAGTSSNEEITSLDTFKQFVKEGQANGSFPMKLLSGSYGQGDKLRLIDFENRSSLTWKVGAKCPSHEDNIILGLDGLDHRIECYSGDTLYLLGSGNDTINDATGNDIYYLGKGDDNVSTSVNTNVFVFEENWGHDKLKISSSLVNTSKIKGYDGSYPWKYSSFIIFAKGINKEDIVWKDKTLFHTKTGDSIELNTKDINIVFANETYSKIDKDYVAVQVEAEKTYLEYLDTENVLIEGDFAYFAKGNDGLYIVDISDFSNLKIVSKVSLPGRAMQVKIENKTAYVAQGGTYLGGTKGWVSLIDIHDPSKAKLISSIRFGKDIFDIAVNDNILYIPESGLFREKAKILNIYNVSNAQEPKLLSKTNLRYHAQHINYINDLIYLSSFQNGFSVFNVKNPAKPIKIAHDDHINMVTGTIQNNGEKVIVSYRGNVFSVYSPSTTSILQTECELSTPTQKNSALPNAIAIRDNLVFKAEAKNGVSISDISTCKTVETISFGNYWVSSIYLIENTLVALNGSGDVKLFNLDEYFPKYKAAKDKQTQLLRRKQEYYDKNKVYKVPEVVVVKPRTRTIPQVKTLKTPTPVKRETLVRIKAKQKGNSIHVKVLIKNDMYDKAEAKRRGLKANYIKHIVARVKDTVVYEAKITPVFSKNPIVKFNYDYLNLGDSIEVEVTDTKDRKTKSKVQIIDSAYTKSLVSNRVGSKHSHKNHSKAFKAKSVESAVTQLYGSSKQIKGKVHISVPKMATNSWNIPVSIKSDIALESMAVFSYGSATPMIGIFEPSEDTKLEYSFKIKSKEECSVIMVVAKGKDGKLYQDSSIMAVRSNCENYARIDCSTLSSKLNQVICSDSSLSLLDRQLNSYFEKLMKTDDLQASRKLLLQQAVWEKAKTKSCAILQKSCLRAYIQDRMTALKQEYTIHQRPVRRSNEPCVFEGLYLPMDVIVYSGGSYTGEEANIQIDESGSNASEFNVVVNSTDKPVALILGAYNPSIWNIKWSKGTKIKAVVAFGHHKQLVVGLPKEVPILSGNNESTCDKKNNIGLFFDKVSDPHYYKMVNELSNRLFSKNVSLLSKATQGELLFGGQLPRNVDLRTSEDTPIESLVDKTIVLAGKKGLEDLEAKGMIRKITPADISRWEKQKQKVYPHKVERKRDPARSRPKYIHNGYVILQKISIPAGLYGGNLATFLLEKGVAYPDGKLGHSTLYEFETTTCNGHGCANYANENNQGSLRL